MLCDNCKLREAKIYYTEIIDRKKKEQHLCEECAKKYTTFHMELPTISKQFTLGNLLSTILNTYVEDEEATEETSLTCSNCKMTYQEFLGQGMMGCVECYKSFKEPLESCIKNIQGSVKHTGKVPIGFETTTEQIIHSMSEVDRLGIKLQQAIEKEEYEEAAKLRDAIRALKKEDEEKYE